jgi:TetR/AcrR family transcriptional regulator, cholesterol catabolism regulator
MATASSDTRKEQIYRAASTLFSERGYRATSIRDIARVLDLQGGSLYAHISSKEDVLWEIIARVAESFYAAVQPIAEADGPAPERLRLMIHAHAGVVINELARAAVFFQDWRQLSEPRKSEVLALRDGYEALFRETIADGVANGELTARDSRLASIFVLTALNGIPGWFRADGERTADDIAEELANLILDGLGRPS